MFVHNPLTPPQVPHRARPPLNRAAPSAFLPESAGGIALGPGTILWTRDLRLYYQPQIDPGSGALHGLEALARWVHPRRGLLAPAAFLPQIEAGPDLYRFTLWTLLQALTQYRIWQTAGWTGCIAVNLSARLLSDPHLPAAIATLLDQSGVAPNRLCLELTETAPLEQSSPARYSWEALATLGVQLAFDDFGTGYAPLSLLQDLPVHQIKLDRRFVQHLPEVPRDLAIVRALTTLGQDLGLVVVAEGVETAGTAAILAALGVPLAQGYYYGPPVPADSLTLPP